MNRPFKNWTEKLCTTGENLLSFAKKCCKNPKTSDMFPRNSRKHNMDTRKPEEFKVQHANTDRLLKSSIIYMQNLLNDDTN